ncbi:MAG: HlyD family efflux transporter periplasmic adaptor subunit [Endozoicomonas sp.]
MSDNGSDFDGALMEPLPPLREDLELLPGPKNMDGSSSWAIYDPLRNRYFRIQQDTVELLRHWHCLLSEKVISEASISLGRQVSAVEVDRLVEFLKQNQLLRVTTSEEAGNLAAVKRKADRQGWYNRLIHGYLFFRIPLVRPDRFLDWLTPALKPLINRKLLAVIVLLGVSGVLLSLRQWDTFLTTAVNLISVEGFVWFAVALSFSKVLHEMGHAIAAKYFGCRVPTMGVAFLVMFPVLYTDTTDAWRLPSYRQRMVIGAAGMLTELSVACVATFLWSFLPDGGLRSAVFVLATVTWVMTLLINLNPLMRFDGYYLLSDWWQVENLQQRAFNLGRWRLREWLFGLGKPMPEPWSRYQARKLLIYAYCTWVYRFFLFLGIALLVYYFFFKALGVILFLVEIIWFIGLPIWQEIKHWWQERENMNWNRQTLFTAAVITVLTLLFFLPVDNSLSLPAVMTAEKTTMVYPPYSGGRVGEVQVAVGDRVDAGQMLILLDSPDLQFKRQMTQEKISLVQTLLNRSATDEENMQAAPVLKRRMASLQEELRGIDKQLEQLVITAPFSGQVTFLDPLLRDGLWVNAGDGLLRLVNIEASQAEAYVPETDLDRVVQGSSARFYSDDTTLSPTVLTVTDISLVNSAVMETEYLSSDYGGPVAVQRDDQGNAVPEDGVYRIILKPEQSEAVSLGRILTGSVNLDARGRSLADYVWENIWTVVIRESGV